MIVCEMAYADDLYRHMLGVNRQHDLYLHLLRMNNVLSQHHEILSISKKRGGHFDFRFRAPLSIDLYNYTRMHACMHARHF